MSTAVDSLPINGKQTSSEPLSKIAFGVPVKAVAATKWQSSMPKAISGNYQTKMVKHQLYHLNISKEAVFNEQRTYDNHKKRKNTKMTIVLMGTVRSRKINSKLYQFKGVTRYGKHVQYYIHTYSHHRIKLSTTQSFAHKAYYYKTNK